MKYRRISQISPGLLALAAVAMLTSGCIYEVGLPADGDQQFSRWLPIQGMHQQAIVKDQQNQPVTREDQPRGMRYPPPETVPADVTPREERPDRSESAELQNPVPPTEENLEYGQYLFEENCAVCHGIQGHGQGTIVEAGHYQPNVPSFHTGPMRQQADGAIYHTITYGTNQMWSYENKLTEIERWAVVNYVRALQRSEYPEPRDVERARNQ